MARGKKGPSFAQCNQCKLVFKNGKDCKKHATLTRHVHKPCYFCTVCSAAFKTRGKRQKHVTSAGHVQIEPTTYAKVPARPAAPASTSASAAPRVAALPGQPAASKVTSIPQPAISEESDSDTSDDEAPIRKPPPSPAPNVPVAGREKREPICATCHERFEDGVALIAHCKADHPPMWGTKSSGASTSQPKRFEHKEQCSARKPSQIARPGEANANLNKHATDDPSSASTSTATPSSTSVRGNDGPQAAPTPAEIENTRCTKCDAVFSSAEALQAHYDESPLHPTCRTCGLGFPAIGPWAAHKARCPPPGSTTATDSAVGDRVSDASSRKGKEVARDLVPTSENVDVDSDANAERTSHIGQVEDAATAGDTSSTTLPADLSDVSSVTLPTPTRPDIMNSQHMLTSPTPSITASTASAVPYAHSSSQTISPRSLLEDETDKAYRAFRSGEDTKPEASPQRAHELPAQPHGRPFSQAEGSSRSVTDSVPTRGSPATYPTPFSGHTRNGTPNDRRWYHAAAQAAQTLRPNTNRNPDVTAVSFHCRSCLRDPCVEPVATMCGHLFCHRCIVQELSTKMGCPVCQKTFFVRLYVEVE